MTYGRKINDLFALIIPRKKPGVILVVFIALALAIAAYLFFARKPRENSEFKLAQNAARLRQIEALKSDSDGDGLRDWEEAIFHTDPKNPDTDTDATTDGEEVRLGRNPLKPNTAKNLADPDDLAATSTPLAAMPQADTSQSANLTQLIAQSLGQQLISRRLTDPEAQIDPEAIGRNIAQGIPSYIPETPLLTLKDITITQDNSDAAVKEWAQRFDATLKQLFPGDNQAEVYILIDALQKENYDLLAGLDLRIAAYDAASAKIKKLPVPSSFAPYELAFLNIMLRWRDITSKFRNAEKDPVAAISTISPYFDLAQELQNWQTAIQQEFTKQHIVFATP